MIVKNAIKCIKCGDVIESKTVHDYVECSCGSVAVDGGHSYLKRSAVSMDSYVELSEVVDNG